MQELNLSVGQKVWSIQLGECEVVGIDSSSVYPFELKGENSVFTYFYTKDFKHHEDNFYTSLFESNPFENISTLEKVSEPENKADLINALFNVLQNSSYTDLKIIAETKLKKLLESL